MALDPDNIDIETEEFFYNLVEIAPEEDAIIQIMREGKWFQVVLLSKHTRLSEDEKLMLLHKDFVDWAAFSADVLLANAIHRATSITNAPPRSKKLTATKLEIIDKFQESFYPESVEGNAEKMFRWRSALRSLAVDFCRLLEEGMLRPKRPLNEVIAEILAIEWSPYDSVHAETIYYIAGTILEMINKLSKKMKGEMREALKLLRKSAMLSKQEAKRLSLPTTRVEEREKVELTYSNHDFYNFLLKIESVHQTLIKEKNVAMFGVGIVCDTGYVLESFSEETGFSKLLPDSVSNETKASVYRAILKSYSNTRGRDYSYKKNAMAPPNTKQGLRPTLAVEAQVAKTKKEKNKSTKNAKGKNDKDTNTAATTESRAAATNTTAAATATTANASEPNIQSGVIPKIGMKVAVRYDEGVYTGTIEEVNESDSIHNIRVTWDCGDPEEWFTFPDPEDGITLIENEEGMMQADGDCQLYSATDEELMEEMNKIEMQMKEALEENDE